jgi:hypothetical protein
VNNRKRAGFLNLSRLKNCVSRSEPIGLLHLMGVHVGQKRQHETHDLVLIKETFYQVLGLNATTTDASHVNFEKGCRSVPKERGKKFELN